MAKGEWTGQGNALFYGDCLDVLRESIATESIDLVYLDPPFNSQRDYNLLFKTPTGHQSEAQITAFEDTWHWGDQAEKEFDELLHQPNTDIAAMMRALRSFLGENDVMAYLTMMANRLIELHRVLKSSGSLYLHCDPVASHYLKVVLDGVFGKENFLSEVIWKRSSAHSSAKRYAPVHDVIFFYAKSGEYTWNPAFQPIPQETVDQWYNNVEEGTDRRFNRADLTAPGVRTGQSGAEWRGLNPTTKGRHWAIPGFVGKIVEGLETLDALDALDKSKRLFWPKKEGGMPMLKRYLDESPGIPALDVITDVKPLNNVSSERLGYPTQKPEALLERFIKASSNAGETVLDPFCGCGTAIAVAQKLGRRWIGIDITHLAITLIEKRLRDAFKDEVTFEVHGTPEDLDAARDLFQRDKYQFQWWAVSLVDAQPSQGKKKGADGGVDGIKYCYDLGDKAAKKIVVSVKGGNLKADDVRALNHVREREKAEFALFVCLNEPTTGMKKDAASAGIYTDAAGRKHPRVQLLTIQGLLDGTQRPQHPDYVPSATFKTAKREKANQTKEMFED